MIDNQMKSAATILFSIVLAGCAMNKSLHIPAQNGDLVTVRAEIEGGTDVNSTDIAGQTPLMYAAEQGRIAVVEYLIAKGADVNAVSGRQGIGSALIYASSTGRVAVMECLLTHGADINATSVNNETALVYATAKGHVKAVEVLLKNNADIDIRNHDGETAMDAARALNREDIVRLLSENK